MKPKIIALISGLAWGIIAAFIFSPKSSWGHIHTVRWFACLLAPLVGLGIFYCSRWSYGKNIGVRILWSLTSLYLASGIYGLIIGFMTWPMLSGTNFGAVLEPVMAFWLGITFFGYILILGPISFLNHHILRKIENH
jgi:hypothetical protein